MPFSGMSVSFKTVVSGYKGFTYRSFAGTLFLACRNRYNFHCLDSIFIREKFKSQITSTKFK